jgi:hypothetical protein
LGNERIQFKPFKKFKLFKPPLPFDVAQGRLSSPATRGRIKERV